MRYHGGPKEGQPEELDEDVKEDDSPPVAEIVEIDSGNEPTNGYGSEVVRDPTKGKTPSTVGENGESFKDKTLFLREAKFLGKRVAKQLERKREGQKCSISIADYTIPYYQAEHPPPADPGFTIQSPTFLSVNATLQVLSSGVNHKVLVRKNHFSSMKPRKLRMCDQGHLFYNPIVKENRAIGAYPFDT
ncbi:hypothetical protein M9H77_23594 [Catharanthus roseus]|uniref:Uncharacterized protein n=1 Tax=Catharanthus roseus TaxID=4058 RepID=A0ACC0AU71_CATRO|nr:hypothetical protein M9H77_23594 [Catharanthus roseus]